MPSQTTATNVVYIVCHDLGRMLGCYGRPFATPYLDRFAGEGVTFTNEFSDAAIEFLEANRSPSQPFLLHVGTQEVHASQWQKKFPPRDARGENLTLRKYAWIDEQHTAVLDSYMPDTPAMRAEAARFAGCLAYHDFHVGRLFGALDLLGLRERTLVVFTTDHGVSGLHAKGTLYDMGTETALLMRGPGLPSGTVVEDLVSNIDLAPTMLEACEIPVPEHVHGRSVWRRAKTREGSHRERLFTERNYHGGLAEPRGDGTSANYDPIRSVRTPQYHLIRNFDPEAKRQWTPEDVPFLSDTYPMWFDQMASPPTEPRPEIELYDVSADPAERANIADDPAVADVRRELIAALDNWMRDTSDPLLNGPIPDRASAWPNPPGERSQSKQPEQPR